MSALDGGISQHFWCHSCSHEIVPQLPDFTCPSCEGGFIEELNEVERADDPEDDWGGAGGGASFVFNWDDANRDANSMLQDAESNVAFGNDASEAFGTIMQQILGGLAASRHGGVGRGAARTTTAGTPGATTGADASSGGAAGQDQAQLNMANPLDDLVQQIFLQLGPVMNMLPVMHGNPQDYVMTPGGLDAVITQLLNQYEGGVPAASEEEISKIKQTVISEVHVTKQLQCSVCWDQYSVGEDVKELPCGHLYHPDCVLPWLREHNSCPVCRITLSGEPASTDDHAPPPREPDNDDGNTRGASMFPPPTMFS